MHNLGSLFLFPMSWKGKPLHKPTPLDALFVGLATVSSSAAPLVACRRPLRSDCIPVYKAMV